MQLIILFISHTAVTDFYSPPNNPKNTIDAFYGPVKFLSSCIPIGPGWFILTSSLLFTNFLWNAFEKGHKVNYLSLFVIRFIKLAVPMLFLIIIDKYIIKDWIATFVQTPVHYPQKDTNDFLPLTFIQNYIWNLDDYVLNLN